jgi:head-tail adaptor
MSGNRLVMAGRLNRRVTILRRTVATNSLNEEIEGLPAKTETFAGVMPAPGTERFASAEMAAQAPMRFILRFRPDPPTVKDAIRFDGHDYAISSVTEIGTREGWEILAVARADLSEE